MKRFGVMLDMSRNAVMKPEEVKNFARTIKALGYNMIQLYTEDTYEVENEPYFGYMRGRYTVNELKDIVDYCNGIGVEVIPCIQTLAHLNQIFRWGDYGSINDFADILLTEEPRTYELIENMFRTLRKSFTSEYVHIGMDEAHMLGLGKYLDKHGVVNRFEILSKHLKRVIELAEKYAFKPVMWSDMFFRLANKGEYYPQDPEVSEEVVALTPKQVGLVYWDYYHDDKQVYDKMFAAHKRFGNEIWFAGGAWTWTGFAPGNRKTLETMIPAMLSAKEQGIENIFITMWGDNGKECSQYAVLPSLFTVRRFYDGERDMEKIKAEFAAITGESYEEMSALDIPNYVAGNGTCTSNVCKHMLYNDPFFGALDTTVREGVCEEYKQYAKTLSEYAGRSKNYGYIFESEAALCELLSVKYDLGARTRKAYKAGDKTQLAQIADDYTVALEKLERFYEKFAALWYKENKPHGFEVQELRLGGLMQRLRSCRNRLNAYLVGSETELPELEEELLDWFGGGKDRNEKEIPCFNHWAFNASVNII